MTKLRKTEIALERLGDDIIERARFNLNLSGFARPKNRKINATKNLSNSLSFEIVKIPKGYSFKFFGTNYAQFVEEGRNPGSFTPIKPLMEWIVEKGIRPRKNGKFVSTKGVQADQQIRSFAYAISKTNKRTGIEKTNFLEDAINTVVQRSEDKIIDSIIEDLEFNITDFSK
jgi:hypothetical protein